MMQTFRCLPAMLLIVGITACSSNTRPIDETHASKSSPTATSSTQYTCIPFQVEGGWGYDILIDTVRYVHQEHIPAINGLHPFASESDAYKTGELAIKKLEQGIMPPTITVEELRELGIVITAL
ncbi:MAG TPA: DUF4907 domain-containing protein [Chitinophagales bacterium]|nr:DUF4907 domain-containing protein [Chitinophagales bacterium]HMX04690.1 DUF4907 domain-containing protein [Chitinophagales bacterium]HNF69655.1 DUF4907 domain-containing protein [Chitinophagales bacterium]HNJ90472.1 DUF4907 domain-containing protein [Chitinophagales bacterium]HNK99310.1 DUF4907 domain-containing protein [Chitinophagales bacterium]